MPDATNPNLTAHDILARLAPPAGLPPEPVEVPDLGGTVHVRRLTAGGLDDYQRAVDDAGEGSVRGAILAFALGDEAGRPLFAPADATALSNLPAGAATKVIRAFNRINGLVEDEVAKK